MYHELTYSTKRQRILNRVIAAVLTVALAVGLWFAFVAVGDNIREQGELSLQSAILESAKQCCAIEGSYPSSLSYLENNYGLVINHDNYLVTYEVFAENVMPSVVVIAK